MSTAVRSQLVRDYLDQLRVASKDLPSSAAAQLRAQITAHLDDLLLPDADEQEIEAALAELGPPEQVVAEQLELSGRSKLAWVRRTRWRTRIAVLVVLAVIGVVVGDLVSMSTTGDLSGPGSFGWLTTWDKAHSRSTESLSGSADLTAVHPGQLQGFIVSVTNYTHRAQTILGPPAGQHSLGGGTSESIEVSAPNREIDGGGFPKVIKWLPSAKIPPGQSRLVKVSWITTNSCFLSPGGEEGTDTLDLRVKVGLFTRTEHVYLPGSIGLYGTKAKCSEQG